MSWYPPPSGPYPPPSGSPYPPPQASPYGGGGYPPPPGPPGGGYGGGYDGGFPGAGGGGGYNPGYGGGGGARDGGYGPPPGPPPPMDSYRPYPPQQFDAPPGPPPPNHYGRPSQMGNNGYPSPMGYDGPVNFDPPPQPRQGEPYYQYSQCTGRRKALTIGINYVGTSAELKGCWNDSSNITRFLIERYNYRPEDIVSLADRPGASYRDMPLRENMLRAMQWLVSDAQPNDSLFFHYSGHGGQTKDYDGDEEDGQDETIYPLDFKENGHIVDDEIHAIMVAPLPPGCRLTCIFDSCHSGSALDLPYLYSTQGKLKEPNLLADAGSGAMGAVSAYMKGDAGGALKSVFGVGKKVLNGGKADKITKATRTSPADVIAWSGCKDSQTSADASEGGQATGAMSYAFVASLTKLPQQSYMQMLNTIRDELRGKYSQKPQLSSSHPMDTNLLFVM